MRDVNLVRFNGVKDQIAQTRCDDDPSTRLVGFTSLKGMVHQRSGTLDQPCDETRCSRRLY